jgi:hypothetical protein
MRIDYARESTEDQTLDLQRDALKQAKCRQVYEEQATGKNIGRPQLDACLKSVREGDTLVVWRLDRLGRNLADLVAEFERRKINFESLTEKIETVSPDGRLVFHVFAALAEFERNLIRERTVAGLKAASRWEVSSPPCYSSYGAWTLTPVGLAPTDHASLRWTHRFRYPTATAKGLPYVFPQVVLELGTHAEFVPHDRFTLRSFAAEEFPNVVTDGDVAVKALLAKRTFWEKATILHAEYHRPGDKVLPDRYSRHYYDFSMLAQKAIRAEALSDMELLAQVVRHKETFYPSGWARYDLARPGSLRLVPREERLAALERDYRNMGVMIFGEPPAFEAIMGTIAALEQDINSQTCET